MLRLICNVLKNMQRIFLIEENRLILFFWFGGLFAPISMWFLIPYCVKRVKRLPVGDEMVPYVTLLMLIGFSLTLWVAVVAILFEVGVFFGDGSLRLH